MEIKFKRLKLKAKEEWNKLVNALANAHYTYDNVTGGNYSVAAYDLVLSFVTMTYSERQSLREFASEFNGKTWDHLANYAKHDANHWAQMCLKIREDGLSIIDNWDIRKVKKLVELFPGIVPAKYAKAKITCDLVDNEAGTDCDWEVFFDVPERLVA